MESAENFCKLHPRGSAEVSDPRRNNEMPQITKKCPVRDSNPNHRFRRPVLYPVELTGRKSKFIVAFLRGGFSGVRGQTAAPGG